MTEVTLTTKTLPAEVTHTAPIPTAEDAIARASRLATSIADVIERQKLYNIIQGKRHVRVDAWIALGFLDGIVPRERDVREHADGSYEAYVDLIRFRDGAIVGGASALCGVDETRWKRAEKYARRSMAITRATGKAFRLHHSWVMCLAGYEPTPLEEMPTTVDAEERAPTPKRVAAREVVKQNQEIFTGTPEEVEKLKSYLTTKEVPDALHEVIVNLMMNRPKKDISFVINEATAQ